MTFKNSGGTVTQTVTYIYDASNRWVAETIAPTAGTTTQTRFVYDGNQIVMQFDGTGTGALAATSLSHRYLWGPAVDQLLADEQLQGSPQVVWTLGDNQNTVRDLATYNSGTNTTTVVNHRVFSAYGQLESETIPGGSSATVSSLFAYTGRALDKATGLQNNHNRWYDGITGRWLNQDPIGFGGGDANLYRYVGNKPVARTDPSGLVVLLVAAPCAASPVAGTALAGALCVRASYCVGENVVAPVTKDIADWWYDDPRWKRPVDVVDKSKKRGSCFCGWETTDHKGNTRIDWEPSGTGQVTQEACRNYCKNVAGCRKLVKYKWNGQNYDPDF